MRSQGMRRFLRAEGISSEKTARARLAVSLHGRTIEGPAELRQVYAGLHETNGILSEDDAAKLVRPQRSTRHFRRRFKCLTGESFHAVRLKIKMSRGATILAGTDLTIPQIAEFLEYRDRREFEKSFKSVYSVTPHQYRYHFSHPRQQNGQLDPMQLSDVSGSVPRVSGSWLARRTAKDSRLAGSVDAAE